MIMIITDYIIGILTESLVVFLYLALPQFLLLFYRCCYDYTITLRQLVSTLNNVSKPIYTFNI